jgi:hypothetical protein
MKADVTRLNDDMAYEEETMAQHADKLDRRTPAAEAARRDTCADARFKPVRLPAVAAAMQAVKTPPHRRNTHELPAILRREPE